jgi:hypothetical protein
MDNARLLANAVSAWHAASCVFTTPPPSVIAAANLRRAVRVRLRTGQPLALYTCTQHAVHDRDTVLCLTAKLSQRSAAHTYTTPCAVTARTTVTRLQVDEVCDAAAKREQVRYGSTYGFTRVRKVPGCVRTQRHAPQRL